MIDPADYLLLQFEVLAVSARLRRLGHPDTADLVERWAASSDLAHQVGALVGTSPSPANQSGVSSGSQHSGND